MTTHRYLRAYISGIFVPTLVLPFILSGFIFVRLVLKVPVPMERAIIFPMALVPLLWGLWNILWIVTRARTHLPLGLHGMLLPFLLLPAGIGGAVLLDILTPVPGGLLIFHTSQIPYTILGTAFLAVLAGYFLFWHFFVGFVNRVLGIA
ncbi:MAG TPA: hypothetical protein VMV57_11540 [Terracidiphilus sp.]|nr:hypothetical protein [Terracidiphilus sp.]